VLIGSRRFRGSAVRGRAGGMPAIDSTYLMLDAASTGLAVFNLTRNVGGYELGTWLEQTLEPHLSLAPMGRSLRLSRCR
jgi:hypothetical protein